MEFKLLGPLEVLHNGEPVPITGRHRPKLLAMLLLHARSTVSLSRLVDTLWDANPPQTARRQAQNAMAGLRRELSRTADDPIESTPAGYRVTATADEFDLWRFHELVERARAARVEGADDQAATLLRDGLDLWRGEPLAGLTSPGFIAAVTRLTELRLNVTQDRIDIDIALGRSRDVIDELSGLIARYPLRQRLTGQLMTALHHCGGTDDAKRAFERLRRRLADELGLEPDPRVTAIHASLSRTAPPRPASTAPPLAPAQLPAAPGSFTGRDEHLRTLDSLLDAGRCSAVISGMGGVGKTALALKWAHQVRDRFTDGQLYINLRGFDVREPVTPLVALTRFVTSLGQPAETVPADESKAVVMFQSLLADRRMLIVLDNCRDAEQVRPLLPGGRNSFTLVTSRNKLELHSATQDAVPIPLDTLSQHDSMELLSTLIGADLVQADLRSSNEIAELCGRLPLALRVMAANLMARPESSMAHIAAELSGPDRFDHFVADQDPLANLGDVLSHSVRALPTTAAGVLPRLALFPGEDFSSDLAIHVSDRDPQQAATDLKLLETAHLLEHHREGRYRLHDLVREFARSRTHLKLKHPARRRLANRVVDWYYRQRTSLSPTEAHNVVAILNTWEPEIVWRLATTLTRFRGHGFTLNTLLEHAMRVLPFAEKPRDPVGLSNLYRVISLFLRGAGDLHRAIEFSVKAHSTRRAENLGDADGALPYNTAILHLEAGDIAQAKELMHEAVRSAEASDNVENVALCMFGLASVTHDIGDFATALAIRESANELYESVRPARPQDSFTPTMSKLYANNGDLERAAHICGRALPSTVGKSNPRSEATLLLKQAGYLRRLGKFSQAHANIVKATRITELYGFTDLHRRRAIHLAELLSDEGRQTEALTALEYAGNTTNPHRALTATLERIRCVINVRCEHFLEAVEHGVLAHDLYESMPKPFWQAHTLRWLSEAYEGSGDLDRANLADEQCRRMFVHLGVSYPSA